MLYALTYNFEKEYVELLEQVLLFFEKTVICNLEKANSSNIVKYCMLRVCLWFGI